MTCPESGVEHRFIEPSRNNPLCACGLDYVAHLTRMLNEARAACAVKDEAIRRVGELTQYYCGSKVHLWRSEVLDTVSPALASSPGRPLLDEVERLKAELEQERVRLAGCGVAALGYATGENDVSEGSYGWSASFADVKRLRARADTLTAALRVAEEALTAITVQEDGEGYAQWQPCCLASDGTQNPEPEHEPDCIRQRALAAIHAILPPSPE